jgi:hypothetical protein
MNYLIQLSGDGMDPIHSGDMKSWFHFYKWAPGDDDEVFFPVPEDMFPEITEGDTLWFSMDENVLGRVSLLRVQQDDFNDQKELWYNCKDIVLETNAPTDVYAGWTVPK